MARKVDVQAPREADFELRELKSTVVALRARLEESNHVSATKVQEAVAAAPSMTIRPSRHSMVLAPGSAVVEMSIGASVRSSIAVASACISRSRHASDLSPAFHSSALVAS